MTFDLTMSSWTSQQKHRQGEKNKLNFTKIRNSIKRHKEEKGNPQEKILVNHHLMR